MPYIYDKEAWERLAATANAVASYTAYSTYVDNRIGMRGGAGSSAFPAAASTGGKRLIFVAFEPPKNRWHILRAGTT